MALPKVWQLLFLLIFGCISFILIFKWTQSSNHNATYISGTFNMSNQTPTYRSLDTQQIPKFTSKSINPIKNSSHFAVSAFFDHRIKAIRVISIIKRNSTQPLYCYYCNNGQECEFTEAKIDIHRDHFNFPFGAADVLCWGKHIDKATHVCISAEVVSDLNDLHFLPVKNRVMNKSFKYNFTTCISSLFGNYNNVLQVSQSIEMYKLLGVQHVVIYKTSCGSDLEKLLQYYEKEGILEIVPWPIDQFLTPSAGWLVRKHKGDIQYYGQLVTLNECIYRQMYQSKYVLLHDIDEIIMPYKYPNLPLLMEALQRRHKDVAAFLIENHIFPKTQFEDSRRFNRKEWKNIPGVNILEHVHKETFCSINRKIIMNPRSVIQTSVHLVLKHTGKSILVPPEVCQIVHVRESIKKHLTKKKLVTDTRVWDFEKELIKNVDRVLQLSGLLKSQE